MKKHILILGFLVIFGVSHVALATSGACSSHGGVDCSAGAGIDGQAICNDGWDGSSVSYYSVAECQTTKIVSSCVTPVELCVPEVEAQYQSLCAQEQSQAQTYCAQMRTGIARSGGLGADTTPCNAPSTNACNLAALCQSQIDIYNSANQVFNQCISNQTQQQQKMYDLQSQQAEYKLKQAQDESKQAGLDASCGDPLAAYSQVSKKCECPTDFDYTNGKCVLNQEKFNKTSGEILTKIIASSSAATESSSPVYTHYEGLNIPVSHKSPLISEPIPTLASSTATSTSQQPTLSLWTNVKGFIRRFNPFSWFK